MDKTNREFTGRTFLANRRIADDFVNALKIREKEVIIEAFPGPGLLTRSLLYGGLSHPGEGKKDKEEEKEGHKHIPSVVVACEPSPSLLVNGLGMGQAELPSEIPARFESEDYAIYQSKMHPSVHEPRLLFSPSTPYRWPTLSQLIANPLVSSHINKHEGTSGNIDEMGKRPWDASPPNLTIVAQMPLSVAGDQMVSQWIGSCVGSGATDRTWIWQWGRIRLALLVGKNQYDVSPQAIPNSRKKRAN